jgi:hypothetical protein
MNKTIEKKMKISALLLSATSIVCGIARGDEPIPVQQVHRYPEAGGGRFISLADFEDEKQMLDFKITGPAGGTMKRTTSGGATGKAFLDVKLTSHMQGLVITGAPSDWTNRDLFLLAIHVNQPRDDFRLIINYGRRLSGSFTNPVSYLQKGWNKVTVDLNMARDHVEMFDVRSIEIRFLSAEPAVEFQLDDLMLIRTRTDIYADNLGVMKRFVVERDGLWIVAKIVGEFSYRFGPRIIRRSGDPVAGLSRYFLAEAFNLSEDKSRKLNIFKTDEGFGPIPSTAEMAGQPDTNWWGSKVYSRMVVREANAIRAVVAIEWQCFDDMEQWLAEKVRRIRWEYNVYRNGVVFIGLEVPTEREGDKLNFASLRFGINRRAINTTTIIDNNGLTFNGPSGNAVATIVQAGNQPANISSSSPDGPRFRFNILDYPLAGWGGCFSWCPQGTPAGKMLGETISPVPPEIQTGRLDVSTAGDFNADGFAEGRGCITLRCSQGRLRARLKERVSQTTPAWEVAGVPERCWVQAAGQVIEPVASLEDGRILFFLPAGLPAGTEIVILPDQQQR